MRRLVHPFAFICLALAIFAAPGRMLWPAQPCHPAQAGHHGKHSDLSAHRAPDKAADLCARWCALSCVSLVVPAVAALHGPAVFATAAWRVPLPHREGMSPEPDDPPPRPAA